MGCKKRGARTLSSSYSFGMGMFDVDSFFISLPMSTITFIATLLVPRPPKQTLHRDEPLMGSINHLDPIGTVIFIPAIVCLSVFRTTVRAGPHTPMAQLASSTSSCWPSMLPLLCLGAEQFIISTAYRSGSWRSRVWSTRPACAHIERRVCLSVWRVDDDARLLHAVHDPHHHADAKRHGHSST